jgi:parallel beta-helix repeat protein
VKAADGTIHIESDGSVDPSSAPILNVGNVSYTFTADINGSLVIERDNIVLDGAGHTLQGVASGNGVFLNSTSNVTVKNINVTGFSDGIYLSHASGSTVSNNNVIMNSNFGVCLDRCSSSTVSENEATANYYEGIYLGSSDNIIISMNNATANGESGIYLYYCSGSTVSGNKATANLYDGIQLNSCSGNTFLGNSVTANGGNGIELDSSDNNIFSGNNASNNGLYGFYLYYSSNNRICHNNIGGNNCGQVYIDGTPNAWNSGYPSGGNYWSDYGDVDQKSGPSQNVTGSDGIGDTPYVIDASNVDHYPLIGPWNPTLSVEGVTAWYWTSNTTINSVVVGDVNGDGQKETVTGGTFYDGSRNVAQLVVWNSSSLAPELLTAWYWTGNTTISSIAIGDVNGDGQTDIVTGGYYFDGTRQVAQLVVWNGSSLAVEEIKTWYWTGDTVINSVALGDVDADGQVEIVTGGYYNDGTRNVAQLVVWNGSDLAVDRLTTWYWTNNTVINSVAIGDVDEDGQVEIVTGGTFNDGTRDVAQLVVWTGSGLAVDRLTEWYWTSNTVINSVALGDVDADGQIEIVTAGYYNDGTRNIAQLVVWTGSALTVDRLTAWYWTGNTVINSVALGDTYGDGQVDVVTGGYYNDGTRNIAQIVAWSGSSLAVENVRTWYWTNDTTINSLCLSDINGDFAAETMTGGAYNDGTHSIAQLVIWEMRQTV